MNNLFNQVNDGIMLDEIGQDNLRKHMVRTYMWMFMGILVTTIVAYFVGTKTDFVYEVLLNYNWVSIALIIAQFGVVIALTARLIKMSETSAKVLFIVYAILTGVTFSVLGYIYGLSAITSAFAATCLYFGMLTVIGLTTKADLTKLGTVCYVGLFAMIIYSVIGMFLNLPMENTIYCVFGLLLFSGITAWDTQKAKRLFVQYQGDEAMQNKLGIYSAFSLYLDFINIFILILRLMGRRK